MRDVVKQPTPSHMIFFDKLRSWPGKTEAMR